MLKHVADGDLLTPWSQSPHSLLSPSPHSSFMDDVPKKRKIKAKSQPDVTGMGAQLCPVFPFLSGETLWVRPPGPGSAFCWGF